MTPRDRSAHAPAARRSPLPRRRKTSRAPKLWVLLATRPRRPRSTASLTRPRTGLRGVPPSRSARALRQSTTQGAAMPDAENAAHPERIAQTAIATRHGIAERRRHREDPAKLPRSAQALSRAIDAEKGPRDLARDAPRVSMKRRTSDNANAEMTPRDGTRRRRHRNARSLRHLPPRPRRPRGWRRGGGAAGARDAPRGGIARVSDAPMTLRRPQTPVLIIPLGRRSLRARAEPRGDRPPAPRAQSLPAGGERREREHPRRPFPRQPGRAGGRGPPSRTRQSVLLLKPDPVRPAPPPPSSASCPSRRRPAQPSPFVSDPRSSTSPTPSRLPLGVRRSRPRRAPASPGKVGPGEGGRRGECHRRWTGAKGVCARKQREGGKKRAAQEGSAAKG